MVTQLQLFEIHGRAQRILSQDEFVLEIETFHEFGKQTVVLPFPDSSLAVKLYINEFWTSKQRAAHSLHEISYRACFKPQLPRFFIERLTAPNEVVYDPFMGRGTTLLEAALLGRRPVGCDISPLSKILILPRFDPPELDEVRNRLKTIDLNRKTDIWEDLLVFYHPRTLQAITNLRKYLIEKASSGLLDQVDNWIRMVATNRLSGHSRGFLSVFTLPPNQAISVERQRRINDMRNQTPPERDLTEIIVTKSKSLLRQLDSQQKRLLREAAESPLLITGSCDATPEIQDESVHLVVTSPPFLDVVDYQTDNWLRCWFNNIDGSAIKIWQLHDPIQWQDKMKAVFVELRRVLAPGGYAAFEVGEVRGGKLLLETLVAPAAREAGLTPVMVIVNDQVFTKTSNCWGIKNLRKGTNTNRIVVLRKADRSPRK
jgi:DNA modification methylase